jgi:hypothetical protein
MSAVVTGQRDVVFTPFMLRIRDVVEGADRTARLRVRLAALRSVARATDDWFSLRARSEQVIAEANAMLAGRAAPVDLQDEYGTGQLGFALSHGDRSARITVGRAGRQAWVELQRPYAASAKPVEPEDGGVLEDLVVELFGGGQPAVGEPTSQEGQS